jgi:hypothetical protein
MAIDEQTAGMITNEIIFTNTFLVLYIINFRALN